jgi:hypothetical protein
VGAQLPGADAQHAGGEDLGDLGEAVRGGWALCISVRVHGSTL